MQARYYVVRQDKQQPQLEQSKERSLSCSAKPDVWGACDTPWGTRNCQQCCAVILVLPFITR